MLDLGWDTRFNYMDRAGGTVTDRGVQYRLRTRARLSVTRSGNTYFEVRAETGKGFDNSWNNSGLGLGVWQTVFDVKSIALHQKFGNSWEAQAGGLEFDRGAGTDAVYASGDGHMTGYRVAFSGKSAGLPDKISLTAAYLGDFDRQNFFSRARMDRVNYWQLLAEHRLRENLDGSAEVDAIHGAVFGRAAIRFRRLWGVDDPTLETVVRATDRVRIGWAMTIGRRWSSDSRWRSDLIYADLPESLYLVDGRRVLMNRGEIDTGKRLAIGTAYRLTPDCEIGVFGGRLLDSTPSKRWIAQVGISYQFAGLLNRLLR